MGVRVLGTGQLRPRRRRHQRPPAPAPRVRLRLDRQADRHPRTPARPAAPGDQRPVPSRRPAAASTHAGVDAARHRPARPGDVHAGHVVPVDGLPGAGPAQADRARPSRSRPPAPASCTRSSPAAAYVVAGASDLALVIGGDCNSRILNPDDIKTYPLFGDGAGAVLLTRGRPDQGILSYSMGADGCGGDLLSRPAVRQPPAADAGAARPRACTTCTWTAGPSSAGPSPSCATRSRTCSRRRPDARRRRPVHPAPGQHPHHQRRHRRAAHPAAARSSTTSNATATRRPARSRWRWTRRSPRAGSSRATSRPERLRGRPGLGHGALRW